MENRREILFRAWDAEIKRFHYWDSESQVHDNVFWSMAKAENMPITQYSGLTDKNGKRIFEYDIVSYEDYRGGEDVIIKEEVKFQAGAFYPVCVMVSEEYTVIGNIFDINVNK